LLKTFLVTLLLINNLIKLLINIQYNYNKYNDLIYEVEIITLIIGDWGLGIGDWAQSPIPNPQSPNKKNYLY